MRFVLLSLLALLAAPTYAEIKFIEVDGVALEYEISGSGNRTVLLEAGGFGGITDWDDVYDAYSEHATVIRYSRVGHLNSEKTGKQYSASEFAVMANGLLEALGIHEKITLVGASYGGRIAKFFAAKYPEKLEAMLLLDPSHHLDVAIMRDIDLELANEQISTIKASDYKSVGHWPGLDDAWSKTPAPGATEIPDIPITVVVSIRRHDNPGHLLETDPGRIGWAKVHADWVDDFPQGRLVLTDRVYHYMQADSPEFVVEQFVEFLDRPLEQLCEQ